MSVEYKPDRDYWNVAKGIGIILIIIGHTCIGWTSNFVYIFHLPLFFFISGYLYNEKKYGDNPWLNLQNKIKGLWFPYFIIVSFFVLLHNVFLKIGIQTSGTPHYSMSEILQRVCEALFGKSDEILAGPVWFLRTLAMAMIIIGFMVFFSRFIERITGKALKIAFQAVCVIAMAAVGYLLILMGIQLQADMQIGFVVMPFIWTGCLLRNYKGDIMNLLNPIVAILCFIIVGVVSCNNTVDYAMGNEFPYMHIISLLGIYGCLYVAKLIRRFNVATRVMAFIGELSLYIMFVHFFILRVMDRIISGRVGDITKFDRMPVAFINLWWLYLIICIPLSILIAAVFKKSADYIGKSISNTIKNS